MHGGDNVSSLTVKERIRKIVSAEDGKRPLSDAAIVKVLLGEGLQIARRTVAKYREELKIPSSGSSQSRSVLRRARCRSTSRVAQVAITPAHPASSPKKSCRRSRKLLDGPIEVHVRPGGREAPAPRRDPGEVAHRASCRERGDRGPLRVHRRCRGQARAPGAQAQGEAHQPQEARAPGRRGLEAAATSSTRPRGRAQRSRGSSPATATG